MDLSGKFIAANVDGSLNCDSKTGLWCASAITDSTGIGSEEKIDFIYKGKNGSYYIDAVMAKKNFYIICDSMEEAVNMCHRKNRLINGAREDRNLLASRGRFI